MRSHPTHLSTVRPRRAFLDRVARLAAGGLLASAPAIRAAPRPAATRAPGLPDSTDPSTDPTQASALKLAHLIRSGQISARDALETCLRRIEAVNPQLNAVVMTCYERARAEAAHADEAQARGQLLGPLHGVPMTIKDSFDTAGVISTAGTIGRQFFVPAEDATVVARLRAAGAILVGKSNTPEFTMSSGGVPGLHTTANIVYGLTHNPYNLLRSTYGSSGGAAAIVAAGGVPFDVGTDWSSSIRGPAHNNGVAGLKPTVGRVPRTGHIVGYGGLFDSWQQVGPIARRVEDLGFLGSILAGPDGRDAAIVPMPWPDPGTVDDVRHYRVAFYADNAFTPTDAATIDTVRAAARHFADHGCEVVEDLPKQIINDLEEARGELSRCVWADLRRLAEKCGSKAVSPTITAHYDDPVPTVPEVNRWQERLDLSRSRLLHWIHAYDIVLTPVVGTPAQPINRGIDSPGTRRGVGYNSVHNVSGYPVVVVRAGTSPDGLPIGVQVIGQPWTEDKVLAAAAYLESRTGGYIRPPL